jgi:hypothetical protein
VRLVSPTWGRLTCWFCLTCGPCWSCRSRDGRGQPRSRPVWPVLCQPWLSPAMIVGHSCRKSGNPGPRSWNSRPFAPDETVRALAGAVTGTRTDQCDQCERQRDARPVQTCGQPPGSPPLLSHGGGVSMDRRWAERRRASAARPGLPPVRALPTRGPGDWRMITARSGEVGGVTCPLPSR